MSIDSPNKLKLEGNEFFGRKDFESALSKYTKAINLDEANPILYSNRAATYLNLSNWKRAIDDCDTGLKLVGRKDIAALSPVEVKLLCRKAIGLRNSDKPKEALKCINDALLIDPTNKALKSEWHLLVRNEQLAESNFGQITNNAHLVTVDIQEVDEIPKDFFSQNPNAEEFSSGISNEGSPIRTEAHEEYHSASEGMTVSGIDNHTGTPEYPSHPTVQFLSALRLQPETKRQSYYEYVLSVNPQQYRDIYKMTGLDPEFLNFFLEACVYALQNDHLQYKESILNLLSLFASLPRFSLTSMFADSSKIQSLKLLFKNKINKNFGEFWN